MDGPIVVVVRPDRGHDPFRSGDALFVVDENKRVSQWNRAMEALTGIPTSGVLGRKCWDVLEGRTEGGTLVCAPVCVLAAGCDPARLGLVINTAHSKRSVLMSTIACETPAGTRLIHILSPEDAPDVVDLDSLTRRE